MSIFLLKAVKQSTKN